MFKKRDLVIILILAAALALSLFLYWSQHQDFSVGKTSAVFGSNSNTLLIRLDPEAETLQKISFDFPFSNHQVYLEDPLTGEMVKLSSGDYYDFGSYIFHSTLKVGREEYDLWVTNGQLPIISIATAGQDIPNEPKVPCIISSLDKNISHNITAEIETVNNYQHCPQPSYSFNLTGNPLTGKPAPLMDYGNDTRFILSAPYFDPSLMREKLAYDLYSLIDEQDSLAPRYVELFVEGGYQGIYILYQRHSPSLFSVDEKQGALFEASGWQANFAHGIQGFSQVGSQDDRFFMLEGLIQQVYQQQFPSGLDLESAVDNYLLYLYSGCSHPLAAHQFIYGQTADEKLKLAPGDYYQSSWGRDSRSIKLPPEVLKLGRLFSLLEEEPQFKQMLQNKWEDLKDSLLSTQQMQSLIQANAGQLKPALERNRIRWPYQPELFEDSPSFSQELEYMQSYMGQRWEWLDSYLNTSLDIYIGGQKAAVNHETKTIYCSLEPGADTRQVIEASLPAGSSIHIQPLSYGSFNLDYLQQKDRYPDDGFLNLDEPSPQIKINIESIEEGAALSGIIEVTGWAVNSQFQSDPGIEAIYLSDGPLSGQNYLGQAGYGQARIDVAQNFGNQNYSNCGFSFSFDSAYLANGSHSLYVYAVGKDGSYSVARVDFNLDNLNSMSDYPVPQTGYLSPGQHYDFVDFIYHGNLALEGHGTYELWVTTGQIPIITIDTGGQDIINFPKIGCQFQLISAENWYNYHTPPMEGLIEVRGGSSRFSQKKSYSFKFERSLVHNIDLDLLDMVQARKWILNSCFLDRSFMRDKISYDLFNQLRDDRHYDFASQTKFVEVFVNGSYNGLYLLTERIDEDSLNLADYSPDDPMHSVVYKSYSSATSWRRFNTDLDYIPFDKLGPYHGYLQKEPNPDNPDHQEFWSPLAYFKEMAIKSPDPYFSQHIEGMLDTSNAIDLHLLILVTGADDALLNNQYLARDNQRDSLFFFVPWDYNASFGRNAYSIKTSFARWYSNGLLDRLLLLSPYQQEFKNRWNQVRESVFSYQNIEQMIEENARLIEDAAARNFKKYPIIVGDDWKRDQHIDPYDFNQELDYLKSWAHNRINFLDAYINSTTDLAQNMVNEAIRINVDYPLAAQEVNQEFVLSGWAVNIASQQETGIQKLTVFKETGGRLELLTEVSYGQPREDVAQFFSVPGYEPCGFSAPIALDQLDKGINLLWIFAYDYQGKYNIAPLEITVKY